MTTDGEKKLGHKMQYTYGRGKIKVMCSCGNAQIPWQPGDTPAAELQSMLAKAHPRV
jgi:hypothetical protein